MPSSLPHTIPSNTETERLPDGTPLVLVEVKGGTFMMGDDGDGSEKPDHPVQLRDFYMGQYPITNQQFAAFLNTYKSDHIKTGSFAEQRIVIEHKWGVQKKENRWMSVPGFERHPVVAVTWYGAREFCTWLSRFGEANYNLPSEAQWEYAARGGQQSQDFPFSGSHKLKEAGWFSKISHREPKPIKLKLPNELGIYDLSGNVWEWCLDHYQNQCPAPKDGMPWVDPQRITEVGFARVIRGGSWISSVSNCRVSSRDRNPATNWNSDVGFRVARC